jgi:hypothetical protein
MNEHIKSCIIIYGWIDNCLDQFYNKESPLYDFNIILIEPRKTYIDKINQYYKIHSKKLTNLIVIKKALVSNNTLKESILCYDNHMYFVENTEIVSKSNDKLTREVVYNTTFTNIINTYNIQNIKTLIININVNNLDNIFENIILFNHIISQVKIKYYCNKNNSKTAFLNNFIEINDKEITYKEITYKEYQVYSHKNLNVSLPNIAIYFSNFDFLKNNIDKLKLFIHQYQMNLILNKSENVTIPYLNTLDTLNYLSNLENNTSCIKNNKIYHQNIIDNLENIFSSPKIPVNEIDIIIQFTPKFLNNNILQIMYPLKDNVLYVNKMFDVIYATKSCMYMLYQILKSKYFTDYIDEKNNIKPSLFKIFSKKYFYDYISKIFIVKEF